MNFWQTISFNRLFKFFNRLPITSLLLAAFIAINFFWTKPLVPGFDTPFYLSEIRLFSNDFPDPLTYIYKNRYLTIAFPGLLSAIFGFDPVISYRLSVSAEYIFIAYLLYLLFKNTVRDETAAAILSSGIVISPFLITYSTMLYANFTGLLVLFLFFVIEMQKEFKYKRLLLIIIFVSMFFIHNFSAATLTLIVGSYYLLKTIFAKRFTITRKNMLIIIAVFVASTAGFLKYTSIEFTPLYTAVNIGALNTVKLPALPQPVKLGNEWQRTHNSFFNHSGKYWLMYFLIIIPILTYISRKEIFKHKKNFIFPLALLLPSLVFSFQPFFNLNFLPERFASLVALSLYFIYVAIISLPRFKKYIIPLAIMPLLLNYLSADTLILDRGYRSFSSEEIEVYKKIKYHTDPRGIILISSSHYYWSQYFLENYSLISGDHFISCGVIKDPGYFGQANYIFAKLLAENDVATASDQLQKLKSIFVGDRVYIIADTGLSCGHGRILNQLKELKTLFNQNNWYLYEII